jgi:hypothetical protein
MIMFILKAVLPLIYLCTLVGINTQVHAHTLNETTAQVIVRDGQVEVSLLTDFNQLISTLQSDQAWLMGDIDQLMPINLNANQQQAFINNVLQKHTRLLINKHVVLFERIIFKKNEFDKAHANEIIFQAKHQFANITELAISFPKSLSTVHVSVVKPKYKLLAAGDTARITF